VRGCSSIIKKHEIAPRRLSADGGFFLIFLFSQLYVKMAVDRQLIIVG